MNKTINHTPLPWTVDGNINHPAGQRIMSIQGNTICPLDSVFGDQQANAAFIVRACNAFYPMAAYIECRAEYDKHGSTFGSVAAVFSRHGYKGGEYKDFLAQLLEKAVNAKAEGGEA